MYKELNLYDEQLSEQQAQDKFFKAIDLGVDGICTPIYFLPLLSSHVPDGLTLSVPIDYPNGMSDTRVKNHAIMNAIRKGANAVDVVLNPHYIVNGKLELISEGLSSYLGLCEDKNITLRVMLEYRSHELEKLLYVASLLVELNIEYVFPSTGHRVDTYTDNLLAGQSIHHKYPTLNVITNGNIWNHAQYQSILNSKVYGVRFNSIHALQNCLGGV